LELPADATHPVGQDSHALGVAIVILIKKEKKRIKNRY
tara:strand:- start:31 stop:144 length:114 start_codon:yes stop_codon:yes gene_type:complete